MLNKTMRIKSVDPALLRRCLEPLLKALFWRGSPRTLYESLPHFTPIIFVKDLCAALHNLGFESKAAKMHLKTVDTRLLPCLFIPEEGSPKVLLKADAEGIVLYDSAQEQSDVTVRLKPVDETGIIIVFRRFDKVKEAENPKQWFRNAIAPKIKSLYFVGFLTAVQTLLMLASPFFVINVYDKVVTTGSIQMLVLFFIGILMAMAALTVVMMARARILAHLASFVQRRVGDAIFAQILKLPSSYAESATTGMHIARLNDFQSVREFFSSPLLGTLIELPFLFIYFVTIWVIGGWLILVPLIYAVIFALASYILWNIMQKKIQEGSSIKVRRDEFLVETLQHMHSLQFADMRKKWRERYARLNNQAGVLSQRLALINNTGDAVFDVLTMLAGLSLLTVGVISMLSDAPGEHLQVGALIGVMFIIWRILTPFKAIGVQITKLTQLKRSITQINNLMQFQREQDIGREHKNMPLRLAGDIVFSQVNFRYPGATMTTLSGVSFVLKPGQMLALIGTSSAGKSTVLKLILGMYTPQIGHILLDGQDIQQYDVSLLRTQIAYVPQKVELFYGTIAQNLRLSEPTATDEQIIQAAKEANLLKDVLTLPNGFDTRIQNFSERSLSASFRQKISLARAYLRNASILIMDEPSTALDDESSAMLLQMLTNAKGKKTVVFISQRPSQIRMADTALVLQEGKVAVSGTPDEVLEKMAKGLK